jgi:hypothetical protein
MESEDHNDLDEDKRENETKLAAIDEGIASDPSCLKGEELVERHRALMRKLSYVESGGPYSRDEMNKGSGETDAW